jgi:hypothetical protein
MYGPANSTGCGPTAWQPHTPGGSPLGWCFNHNTISGVDTCSTYNNSATCLASWAGYSCGWCSESTFGGGQCQKRNNTAAPAQPQWITSVVLPVCKLNTTAGVPYSFSDKCKAFSDTRANCASAPEYFGCGWCADRSTSPSSVNASCQAATPAGFLSGMTCDADSFLFPAAGYVDPCKQYSTNCSTCSSAPAELNCGQSEIRAA